MPLSAFLSLVCAIFILSMGCYVYFLSSTSRLYRMMGWLCFVCGAWTFCEFGYRQADNLEIAQFWVRMCAALKPLTLGVVFHVCLALTQRRWPRFRLLAVYLPAVFFGVFAFLIPWASPVEKAWGWSYVVDNRSLLYSATVLWIFLLFIPALGLCVSYYRETQESLKKRQVFYVIVALCGTSLLVCVTELSSGLPGVGRPELTTSAFALSCCFILFFIRRDKLIVLTPESVAQEIVSIMPDPLFLLSRDGNIAFVNRALLDLLEFPEVELIGQPVTMLLPDFQFPRISAQAATLSREFRWEASRVSETTFKTRQGVSIPAILSTSVIVDKSGKLGGVVCTGRDITERKHLERRLTFLAMHDPLTGLPNRVLFNDRMRQALALAERSGQRVGLLFLDLDHFKQVNDELGHDFGDSLLKRVAVMLTSFFRRNDTVARLGGDEFVVLMEDVGDMSDIRAGARDLISYLDKSLAFQGRETRVTASIGIAIYPDHASDAGTLMKYADMAMYRAKRNGRDNFEVYSP